MCQKKLEPMSQWALRIAERRNRLIAVTALARKLIGVLWAMWIHGTDYDLEKTALTLADPG